MEDSNPCFINGEKQEVPQAISVLKILNTLLIHELTTQLPLPCLTALNDPDVPNIRCCIA